MELIEDAFKKVKESKNPEALNDFLVKLSKDPKKEYLRFIDHFINNLDPQILEKIKLNLVFILGEIGMVVPLDKKYLRFLSEAYYTSDRWIRKEIIQAFHNISEKKTLSHNIIELVGFALNDDYLPIKNEAQKILLNLKEFPIEIVKNLFHTLNSKESEVITYSSKILEKHFKTGHKIFSLLSESENFKILKPHGIRSLLLICFKSIDDLKKFKGMILNSDWSENYKKSYLKESETLERILIKNL